MPASLHRAMASFASLRGGIDDPDEGEQLQIGDERQQVGRRVERSLVEVAPGNRQDPKSVARQAVVLGQDLTRRVAHRHRRSVSVEIVRRARQQDVRRALDEAAHDLASIVVHLVERRHQLVLGVEWHLAHAGIRLAGLLDVQPTFGGEDDERTLRRISDARPVADDGIVGERHRQHERLERAVAGSRHPEDATGRRVSLTVDAEAPPDDDELASRHLVEREGSGLVGADRRCRAQRLDGLQALDDRSLLSELLRPDREQHRHHGREARRDRGDRQRDAGQEQRIEVLAAGEPQDDDQRQGSRRHDRDDHRELIELLGEWRLLLLDAAQHSGDVTHLARHPGRRDDHLAAASGHLRVHVGHVDPVAERCLLDGDRIDTLGDGRALAGESGLFDLQGRRDQDPAVGGDLVSGFETDDVTWHQFLSRYLDQLPVAAGTGRHDQHLPQGGDALGGLALLMQSHQRVDAPSGR